MTEHDLQNSIRLRLSELGFMVFRANVGKVRLADGRFLTQDCHLDLATCLR